LKLRSAHEANARHAEPPEGARSASIIWRVRTGTRARRNDGAQIQPALFSIVMGVALLLTGIGFLVLTIAVLRPEGTTEPTPQAA
jgi:hypothetical protein